MKGSGRAFCSGGDAVSLYHLLNEGNVEECKRFFETLYEFVYLQGTYLKPHVAIMDGITMGAGAGITLPGMFNLVTDKTAFAPPKAQMGFHPDAGGILGPYRRQAQWSRNDCLSPCYTRLAWIEERLSTLHTDDPSVMETSLAQYGDIVYPEKKSVLSRIDTIDRCFNHDTVEEIFDALEKEASEFYDGWCKITLNKLNEASPLSLKIREGRFQSLDQCLARECRASLTAISKEVSNDFCEGVRARLVDEDFAPKWDPPSLRDVSKDMVDCHFSSRPEVESKLELPTALREPYM